MGMTACQFGLGNAVAGILTDNTRDDNLLLLRASCGLAAPGISRAWWNGDGSRAAPHPGDTHSSAFSSIWACALAARWEEEGDVHGEVGRGREGRRGQRGHAGRARTQRARRPYRKAYLSRPAVHPMSARVRDNHPVLRSPGWPRATCLRRRRWQTCTRLAPEGASSSRPKT